MVTYTNSDNLTITISLDTSTGDPWIDNGIVVLYDLFGEGEHNVLDLLSKLVSRLVEKTGNEGHYYDLELDSFVKYPKETWKTPANLFIKANPTKTKKLICRKDGKNFSCRIKTKENAKIEISEGLRKYLNSYEAEISEKGEIEIFLEAPKWNVNLSFKKREQICSVCGKKDKIVEGKQWMYPFLVDPSKFGNFYSNTKGANYLCLRCALAGFAAYLGWLYALFYEGKTTYLHIFIFHSDLDTMYSMRKGIIKPLSLAGSKERNFPMAFFGKYLHETTMGLILELFKKLKAKEDVDPDVAKFFEEKIMVPSNELRLFAITGNKSKSSKSFSMSEIIEFSKFNSLYALYNQWLKVLSDKYPEMISAMDIVENVFKQFYITQQKQKKETIWRDKICWMVMEFKDPFPYIESFIFEKNRAQRSEKKYGGLIKGTMVIFEEYAKEVLKMDEKQLKILAAFGHEIGEASAKKEDMGILYSLRNAKNIDEFLRVLNDINFKLGLRVNEELLKIEKDKIMGQPWIRIKTLLSIYAMNRYLWIKKNKSEGGEKNGE